MDKIMYIVYEEKEIVCDCGKNTINIAKYMTPRKELAENYINENDNEESTMYYSEISLGEEVYF